MAPCRPVPNWLLPPPVFSAPSSSVFAAAQSRFEWATLWVVDGNGWDPRRNWHRSIMHRSHSGVKGISIGEPLRAGAL